VLWRVARERPFTWIERFRHAGFRPYVLRRRVSRVAMRAPTEPVLVHRLAVGSAPRMRPHAARGRGIRTAGVDFGT